MRISRSYQGGLVKNRLRKMSLVLSVIGFMAVWTPEALSAGEAGPPAPAYLYKTTFVRAAPGKLLDLIGLYKSRMAVEEAAGDVCPFWWGHTQGDPWDL